MVFWGETDLPLKIPSFFSPRGRRDREVTQKVLLGQGRGAREGAVSGGAQDGWTERREIENLKIDSSTVRMESARSYRASSANVAHFSITDYRGGLTQGGNALNTAIGNDGQNGGEKTNQSAQRQKLEDLKIRLQRFGIHVQVRSASSQTFESIRNQTVSYILDLFFGGLFRDGYCRASCGLTLSVTQPVQMQEVRFSQESMFYEAEETSFSTQGKVRTSDGREIDFNIHVGMSREFYQYYGQDLQAKLQLTDPLVINLDGSAAQISDQTFYFDLDADGRLDEVNQLGLGSGFLALDKNGDGTINDGSELFGTASGDGFRDLADYDQDGNGWIDENDAIWHKLQIWCRDENGQDILYRLADKGVGAICLQNVGTEFTQRGQDGDLKGVVRSTGVFLYENGGVGTVQHVDLAKRSYSA